MSSGPRAIGIILDGNRRFAKEKGLSALDGHRRGMEKVRELLSWANEARVRTVYVYAFSTENWKRAPEEVEHLMGLLGEFLDTWFSHKENETVRVRFIGERERFSPALRAKIAEVEEKTGKRDGPTLVIALSYGGRAEIVAAANALLAQKAEAVDEDGFRSAMWSAGLPDPDLILRTGGERRLSNFLPWQSIYSELFFTDTKLPDLSKEEFLGVLEEFELRERRHGK